MTTSDHHSEYLRRNLEVCKAVGAHAAAAKAIVRLVAMKRPPVWVLGAMEAIRARTSGLANELASWRDHAEDSPDYVQGPSRQRIATLEAVILEAARRAEALKRECGMDPESPIAVQNSRYMGLSHFLRSSLSAQQREEIIK